MQIPIQDSQNPHTTTTFSGTQGSEFQHAPQVFLSATKFKNYCPRNCQHLFLILASCLAFRQVRLAYLQAHGNTGPGGMIICGGH